MSTPEPRDPRIVSTTGIPADADPVAEAPHDPLRLCIFATVALLGWLGGPYALVVFALLGFAGYWRARRVGLLASKCLLGDTRLVLLYLGALVIVAGWGIWRVVA